MIQISREIFSDELSDMSRHAKWLYVVMTELSYKKTGERKACFFHSDADLAEKAGLSILRLEKARKELVSEQLIEYIPCGNRARYQVYALR